MIIFLIQNINELKIVLELIKLIEKKTAPVYILILREFLSSFLRNIKLNTILIINVLLLVYMCINKCIATSFYVYKLYVCIQNFRYL